MFLYFLMQLCRHAYPRLRLLLDNVEPDESLEVHLLHIGLERVVEVGNLDNRALNQCKYDDAKELYKETKKVF